MNSPKISCLIVCMKTFVVILNDNSPFIPCQVGHDLDQFWVIMRPLFIFGQQSFVFCDCWKEGLVSILDHISLLIPIYINTLSHHHWPLSKLDQPSMCCSFTDGVFEGNIEIGEDGGVDNMLKLFWGDITCLL